MRLTKKHRISKKVMTKKIGNVRKKFLKRERVMLRTIGLLPSASGGWSFLPVMRKM